MTDPKDRALYTSTRYLNMLPGERAQQYHERLEALRPMIDLVREHREGEPCNLAPLCPGHEVVQVMSEIGIGTDAFLDFTLTCVAALADDAGELDLARARVAQLESLLGSEKEGRTAAEAELVATRADADAGWRAFQSGRDKP